MRKKIIILGLSLFLSLLVYFSNYQLHHSSDTLIPILISVYKWTPFYWEQNRFGMFLPLLFSPLKKPEINLWLQTFICLFTGFLNFFLLGLCLRARKNISFSLIFLAIIFFFLGDKEMINAYFSPGQPYSLSLFFFFLSAYLIRSQRISLIIMAIFLNLLANYINISVIIFSFAYILFFFLHNKRPSSGEKTFTSPQALLLLLWCFFPFFYSYYLSSLFYTEGPYSTQFTLMNPIEVYQKFSHWFPQLIRSWPFFFSMPFLWFFTLIHFCLSLKKKASVSYRPETTFLTQLSYFATFSSLPLFFLDWVGKWGPIERYLTPSALIICLIFSLLTKKLISNALRKIPYKTPEKWPLPLTYLLVMLLSLHIGIKYKVNFTQSPFFYLRKKFGDHYQSILNHKIPLVLGQYWQAWPLVFMANAKSPSYPPNTWAMAKRMGPSSFFVKKLLKNDTLVFVYGPAPRGTITLLKKIDKRNWSLRITRALPNGYLGKLWQY